MARGKSSNNADGNASKINVSPTGEASKKPEPAAWRYTLRKPAPNYPTGSYIRSKGGLKADNQN